MEYPVEASLTVNAKLRADLDKLQAGDADVRSVFNLADRQERGMETEYFFPSVDWRSKEMEKVKTVLKKQEPASFLLKVYGEDCSRATFGSYINNPFDNAPVHDIGFGKRDNPMAVILNLLRRYYGERRARSMLRAALRELNG